MAKKINILRDRWRCSDELLDTQLSTLCILCTELGLDVSLAKKTDWKSKMKMWVHHPKGSKIISKTHMNNFKTNLSYHELINLLHQRLRQTNK